MTQCLQCNKETTNPRFCSHSCSASHWNKAAPKRKRKERCCIQCGAQVERRRTLCSKCAPRIDWSKITYKEVIDRRSHQKHVQIRALARQLYLSLNEHLKCENCGYNKHVEVCHKHAIASFSSDSRITEINDPNNLIGLCPNCHWEFDHGLLSL